MATNEITKAPAIKWYVPQTMDQAKDLAKIIAASGMAPKDFTGRPMDAFVAMIYGAELGLSPLASLQNVAVINGKPSVYGDTLLAICRAHPECNGVEEDVENGVGTCTVYREGEKPIIRTFSVEDAKRAKLWGKRGPWTEYPNRMLQMRARGFALRDSFADALAGIITREEAEDYVTAEVIEPQPAPIEAPVVEESVVDAEVVTEEAAAPEPEPAPKPKAKAKQKSKKKGVEGLLDTMIPEEEESHG